MKELVNSSDIYSSLTPRGRPRRSAEGLTRLQAGSHFPEKIQGTGKKRNITRSCVVCFPQNRILARTGEKTKRPGRESSFQCEVCKVALCIHGKIVFSSTILFRTMLLPIFEDTMQKMIMMMIEIVIN